MSEREKVPTPSGISPDPTVARKFDRNSTLGSILTNPQDAVYEGFYSLPTGSLADAGYDPKLYGKSSGLKPLPRMRVVLDCREATVESLLWQASKQAKISKSPSRDGGMVFVEDSTVWLNFNDVFGKRTSGGMKLGEARNRLADFMLVVLSGYMPKVGAVDLFAKLLDSLSDEAEERLVDEIRAINKAIEKLG